MVLYRYRVEGNPSIKERRNGMIDKIIATLELIIGTGTVISAIIKLLK